MKVTKVICKFACYLTPALRKRTTYRIVQGENNFHEPCFWIEEKSCCGRDWFSTYNHYVHWKTLKELWNSQEFKCLFGQLPNN